MVAEKMSDRQVGVNPSATSDLLDNMPRLPTMSGSASPVSSSDNSQPDEAQACSTSPNLALGQQLQHGSQERSIQGQGDAENPATVDTAEIPKKSIANEPAQAPSAGSKRDSASKTTDEDHVLACPNDELEGKLCIKNESETDGSIAEEQRTCMVPEARDRPPSVITTTTATPIITTSTSLSPPSASSSKKQGNSLRRGKWTVEEEAYVARVIQDFNSGFLDAPAGTTLRTYLSEKLQCDPMRITKKFTGEACIGKRVFHPAVRSPSNAAAIDNAQVSIPVMTRIECFAVFVSGFVTHISCLLSFIP
jgi:hypothetical protein